MTDAIFAQPNLPIYLFMVIVSAWSIALMAIFLVMVTKGPRMIDALIAWGRRTFTAAGDGCIDCNRWTLPVACLSCGRTRILTATTTIATDGQTAASIANARAVRDRDRQQHGIGADGHRVLSPEERRRREALVAFGDIDLMLDDVVVM
jgi:hypothetical protein